MNRVRNILIAVLVGIVFIAAFFIISALTEQPQKCIDFSYPALDGTVTSLKTEAREKGAILIFIDPEVEGSNELLSRLIDKAGDTPVIAVSVSDLSRDEQLGLLPENAKALKNLCFEGDEAIELYNVGNAPITYFIDNEFYVQEAFVKSLSDKSIDKCLKKLVAE